MESFIRHRHTGHARLSQPPSDQNTYALGRILGHNVVIACLPSGNYGTTPAATVATQMLSTFSSIRFGLMVGIGGGVPTTADVRLGDVVVSNSTARFGGVIQYDHGKVVSGVFEHTGTLNKPPQVLSTAISDLRSEHQLGHNRIPSLLAEMVEKYPTMSQFTHRGPESDCLFEAHYDHPESARTCDGCDHDRLVSRQPRVSNDPHIHYGLIASSNKVMKHGQTRDSYARKYGILCFEMEAAGLMDRFPCLVIRGICDYADSHKSKQWQEYAAATAAAYAKELLSVIPISITRASQKAKEVLDSNIPSSDIVRFLALSNRPEWSITHKVGSGKTLVTSTAIDYMIQESKKSGELVAHFFYTHSNRDRLKASHLFESYIKQMLGHLDSMKKPCPPRVRDSIKQLCCPKRNPPTTREIIDEIFFPFCELLPRTTYVADGIDECDPKEVIETLKTFREVTLRHGTKVLISGREDLDVAQFVSGCIKMTMSENDTRRDIRRFIEWKIEEKMWERELTKDQSLLQDVKSKLNGNAERMSV
ncbi:hypothetical protein ASPWEDRAFT_48463 [Aspergillus wentii DTO 134E9]|uniref:Uncharacterized protein n=1 Tax=Aspergillus wentii DTO 134E9 TaxID=1073089 RepID=A0A1L9RT76_ASPWE|nr:uncharacterized protein ASPWEDRAFT_48463 [Aspergillus wentii DTO 134E9]OJJ38129.1 hypothetical protein ASPWEDRAFT_48463 [Aspergillus wentii DTO 134E9]